MEYLQKDLKKHIDNKEKEIIKEYQVIYADPY